MRGRLIQNGYASGMIRSSLPAAAALLLGAFCSFTGATMAGPLVPREVAPQASIHPADQWELEGFTGALWSLGGGASPLDYTFLPQMISIKTPATMHGKLCGGDIFVRHRLTLEGEAIIEGPESYFFGVTFSPSIEWWNARQTCAWYFSAGGGVGVLDSQGYDIPGGQGQDFNLTWFVHSGLKFAVSDSCSVNLGLMFQHISNGGMDDINPGVNALGPTLGVGWRF